EGTNVKLADLTKLCELEFNYLFACHYESILSPDNSVNNHLLGSLILSTAGKIYNSKEKMQELELDKNRSNREYEDYIWSRIVAKKKSNKFLGLIYELEDNITKYTSEKEAALERMKELEKEAEALDELIARLRSEITLDDYTYRFSTPKLIWPVHGEVIRDFGLFTSDEYKVSLVNDGIDICVDEGTPVVTVDDGVVAFAEWYSGAGKLVIIDHQNGFYSLYSHISSILVSKGDKVKREQQIALSGKTGSVDIPCLHFELRKRGTAVNPMEYLENANIQ
ncbi:MAG: peptidoglycan DD-metalloendopeptidase family protein, partial [Candidatus Cloacimonetes bacterium]|nr:peptidoglycan DD-metalloendopeptidase family protein [Candidatus Cloacimonadota bacterium]